MTFTSFTGRTYAEFIAFAKQQLKAGLPVIAVTFLKVRARRRARRGGALQRGGRACRRARECRQFRGGRLAHPFTCPTLPQFHTQQYYDNAYDHIQPVTAIATHAPSAAYDPADVVSTWTDVTTTAVQRAVAGWGCSAAEKNYTIFEGACVPLVSARALGCLGRPLSQRRALGARRLWSARAGASGGRPSGGQQGGLQQPWMAAGSAAALPDARSPLHHPSRTPAGAMASLGPPTPAARAARPCC